MRTRTQESLVVRSERDTDRHPHKHDQLAMELSNALWVLAALSRDGQERQDLFAESLRLADPILERIAHEPKESDFFMLINFYMKKGLQNYLTAAWETLGWSPQENTASHIAEAIKYYNNAHWSLNQIDGRIPKEMKAVREQVGGVAAAIACMDSQEVSEEGRDFMASCMLDEHKALLPEVVFNLARCHALRGNRDETLKTLGELGAYQGQKGYLPSPAITESAQMLEAEVRKARPGQPVIAKSPAMVLAEAHRTAQKFGSIAPRLVVPKINVL